MLTRTLFEHDPKTECREFLDGFRRSRNAGFARCASTGIKRLGKVGCRRPSQDYEVA